MRIKLRKGLDLPLPGEPIQQIERVREPRSVALMGRDHPRNRCDLRVTVGDRVRIGQTLYVDHQHPEIRFTAPAAGAVTRAQRREGRQPISVVIEQEAQDTESTTNEFPAHGFEQVLQLDRGAVTRRMLEAGQWPSLRARPFGRIPEPGTLPDAIFLRVIDTNPLAPEPAIVIGDRLEDLRIGIAALARLTEGPVFVCCDPEAARCIADLEAELERVRVVTFEGPHPAGLVGTHIHHVFPHHLFPARAGREGRVVWYTGYQEGLALGHLFRTGRVDCERVVALAGPPVRNPRLLRTRIGASTEDLVREELWPGECRIVSGSLLSGRRAATAERYVGRYHEQICVIEEGPGPRAVSGGSFALRDSRGRSVWRRATRWTTALHGQPRAMLPLHVFDDVVPLRLPVALLLKSLAAGDFEAARRLGALELEEEDLALCSYLCPGKLEYGELLRRVHDELGGRAA